MVDTIEKLESLAITLNNESNTINPIIQEIQEKLNKLNLGIPVWLNNALLEESKAGNAMSSTTFQYLLGYAKTKEGWGLAIKAVRVQRGFYEGELDCPWAEVFDVGQPVPLLKSSRQLRLAALRQLQDLVETIQHKAQEVIIDIEKAKKMANGI